MQTDGDTFRGALATAIGPWGLQLSEEQLELLGRHFEAMVLANRTMNLTRIVDPVEAAVKHYSDSLALVAWAQRRGEMEGVYLPFRLPVQSPSAPVGKRDGDGTSPGKGERLHVLDIGTGAGFPAVPIAVVRPPWQVTAIDGTKKKIDFVLQVAMELHLENLAAAHAHSDHWHTSQKFDLAATRAVASLEECMRAARPFLRRGGRLVGYKTARLPADEWEAARQAATELGMVIEAPFRYDLNVNGEKLERALYLVRRER